MPDGSASPPLYWTRDAHGWIAPCGEEGQGEARVLGYSNGWAWIVDMLPGTDEAVITAGRAHASLDEAKRLAEQQVAAWPVPIDGARQL
ncbi:hypothetical protein [Neoroseomonas lacus]|uniref:Uncharacterized protein n=1 Tax=Neoroseomonas lacus TaxID=287609 RepID=A0A917KIB8_9PROT|nr:hypothetical protein [Neoroseomonas lacus]GGJ14046.1 hypothetical protein GCM10011320_21650 [Neoroseomonas lacus]